MTLALFLYIMFSIVFICSAVLLADLLWFNSEP